MKVVISALFIFTMTQLIDYSKAFVHTTHRFSKKHDKNILVSAEDQSISRQEFARASTITAVLTLLGDVDPALARGRATLEQSYDRYSPRIIDGGKFFTTDLKRAIDKADWAAIKRQKSHQKGLKKICLKSMVEFLNVLRKLVDFQMQE